MRTSAAHAARPRATIREQLKPLGIGGCHDTVGHPRDLHRSRPEGLISVGGIPTGVIGLIGTARMGPVGEPVTVSSLSQAADVFGTADAFGRPEVFRGWRPVDGPVRNWCSVRTTDPHWSAGRGG
jgi:hypothetical protein